MPVLNAVEAPDFQAPGDVPAALAQALEDARSAWYDAPANAFDYRRFGDAREYESLFAAAARLAAYDCTRLRVGERLPFWINVYNALVLHAVVARGLSGAARLTKEFFVDAEYMVAGHEFSLDDIEHGLIRCNAPRFRAMRRQMAAGDPRLALAPYLFDEQAHFALHSACRSSPRLRVYGKDSLAGALEDAACDYVREHVSVEEGGAALRVPKIFQWYERDFGGEDGVRAFVINRLERVEDIEA
ncbi:MAG: DUF547 domain-containing protein, partial [Burkholderiales bacterium]